MIYFSIMDVANWFIKEAKDRGETIPLEILQALLYYVNEWHRLKTGMTLFTNRISVVSVDRVGYQVIETQYKENGYFKIPLKHKNDNTPFSDLEHTVCMVYKVYYLGMTEERLLRLFQEDTALCWIYLQQKDAEDKHYGEIPESFIHRQFKIKYGQKKRRKR